MTITLEQQAANVTASQTPMHGIRGNIKAGESRLDLTRSPRIPTLAGHPRWPILPILAFLPHVATLLRQDSRVSAGTKLHRASRDLVIEGYKVDCFAAALVWPG